MSPDFCTRITGKIRRLGYAPKVAAFFAGFFVTSMAAVCGLLGALSVFGQVLFFPTNGSGKIPAGARAVLSSPAFSGIRRH